MAKVGTRSACTDTILTMRIPMECFSAVKSRGSRSRQLQTFINASGKHYEPGAKRSYEAQTDFRTAFYERNRTRGRRRAHSHAAAWTGSAALPPQSCLRS